MPLRNPQTSGGGVSTPVSVPNGGTGATSSSGARTNLGAAAAVHTHVVADITDYAPGGGGQLIYKHMVGPDGDYATVGAMAADGFYAAFVQDGTYTEAGIDVPAGTKLTLHGESRDGTILNYTSGAPGAASAIVNGAYDDSVAGGIRLNIDNLTIKVNYAGNIYGIYAQSLIHSRIENVSFVMGTAWSSNNAGFFDIASVDSAGGAADGCDIIDCSFDFLTVLPTHTARAGKLGTNCRAMRNTVISTFLATYVTGFLAAGSVGVLVADNSIDDCYVGVEVGGQYIGCHRNSMRRCVTGILISNANDASVTDNIIQDFWTTGISVMSEQCSVATNVMRTSRSNAAGIDVGFGAAQCAIVGNRVTSEGSGGVGIKVSSATANPDVTYTGNNVSGSTTGMTKVAGLTNHVFTGNIGITDTNAIVIKRRATDATISGSDTPALDASFSVDIGANEVWRFNYTFFIDMGGTVGGFQALLGAVTNGTNDPDIAGSGYFVAESGTGDGSIYSLTYSDAVQEAIGVDSSSPTLDSTRGQLHYSMIVANGAAAKTIAAQLAQFASDASTLTIKAGSHVVAQRIS